jgi:hypothetical protein
MFGIQYSIILMVFFSYIRLALVIVLFFFERFYKSIRDDALSGPYIVTAFNIVAVL